MKIPIFSKLTAKSRGRKVVRASARSMRGGEDEYYEAEPNMKLSHAFMVVLILHVVAVGGIYAFNHIKVNKKTNLLANISGKIAQAAGGAIPSAALASEPAEPQRLPGDADDPLPAMRSASSLPAPVAAAPAVVTAKLATAPAPAAPVVTQTSPPKAEVKKVTPTAARSAAAAPGTYKVAKGDNPYTIAKKVGVSSQELLKLNGIEDPTKLQIGQVLKVPGKAN
ncbi:MAG: LysM domain-containing protein [Chthoniobacterales bacterium]